MQTTTETAPREGSPSPWGTVQHAEALAPGIVQVHTAGHGGLWLSRERVRELSAACVRRSGQYTANPGAGVWWEEDCEAMIPLFFFWPEVSRHWPKPDATRAQLLEFLRRWAPEVLA